MTSLASQPNHGEDVPEVSRNPLTIHERVAYAVEQMLIRYLRVSMYRQIYNKVWWRLMPGAEVKVKWPVGQVPRAYGDERGLHGDPDPFVGESADPSVHYKPWMEAHVGKQGWDWNWDLRDNDSAENRLTIKVRKAKEKYASAIGLMWQ